AAFGRPLQNGALAVAAPAAGLAADLDRAVVDFEAGWAACFAGAAIAATHAVEISSSVTEKRATMRDGFTVPPVPLRTIGKRGGLGIGPPRARTPTRARPRAGSKRGTLAQWGKPLNRDRDERGESAPRACRRAAQRLPAPFRRQRRPTRPVFRRGHLRGGWLGRISTRLYSARAGERSRSRTTAATSSGCNAQPCFAEPRPNSVFTLPGIRYDTRMPSYRTSIINARVKPLSPNLLALYAAPFTNGFFPASEEMLKM